MREYYHNVLWENFIGDLQKKLDVILLCNESGEVHGFTTLAIFSHDENTQLLFSGDTVVKKEYWGAHDLSQAWIKNALTHAEQFSGKTYWLLITKGYKTYKYLHTFFNEFYPRADTQTPPGLQEIMDIFGVAQFGERYKNGVFAEGRDFLKEEFDDMDGSKLRDKNTAFFLEKNPGYKKGDELVCLCELSVDNINKLGRRVLGR